MLADKLTFPGLSEQQQDLFQSLFLNDTPLLDLRSPAEYAAGAFPTSDNIPLMNNEQRALVGTCYKRQGKQAAIDLGHELVSGQSRDDLIGRWKRFCSDNPQGYLYCFRGGLRSRTVASWLQDQGLDYPLIRGGYKALRRYLIAVIDSLSDTSSLLIIGGRTGSAKTDFVNQWQQSIDLEGLANHRGSSFGRRVDPQPTVINFENTLAIEMLKKSQHEARFIVEDEGVTIGSCSLPMALRKKMLQSPILLLEVPLEQRIETILNDYIISLSREYEQSNPQTGYSIYRQEMLDAMTRIKKRLGNVLYHELYADLSKALESRSLNDHRIWISKLLAQYYDPMYNYQIEKKQARIVLRGNQRMLADYLHQSGFHKVDDKIC